MDEKPEGTTEQQVQPRPLSTLHAAQRVMRFLIRAYREHWVATPAAAIAAVVSTVGAAAILHFIAPLFRIVLSEFSARVVDCIVGPLTAYVLYLACYYFGMFLAERKELFDPQGKLDQTKFREWRRVVKYDYLAHVPSDCYLISLAALMQFSLQSAGMGVFSAILISQFVDDFITFLKEPAIWGGAKAVAAWETKAGESAWSVVKKRTSKLFRW